MAEGSQDRMENRDNEAANCPSSSLNAANYSNGPMVSNPNDALVSVPMSSKGQSAASHRDSYWFAQSHGGEISTEQQVHQNRGGESVDSDEHSPGSGSSAVLREREERARLLRERQTEDRVRKVEELRSATVQAQRFREQQEEERRRRIEEIRSRDMERRNQVEERKKHIWEVEKERRDGILRKSQERDARVEAIRNAHRSSIGFAFGSCTPRLLELDPPSVFGGRRSTSQNNVTLSAVPASRAIDIDLGGDRTQRTGEDPMTRSTSAIMGSVLRRGRRRTDLIPTTPTTYRESSAGGGGPPPSSCAPGSSGQRGASPGRAYSMSRLDQLALPKRSYTLEAVHESRGHNLSKTKSMSHLAYRKAGTAKGGSRACASSSSSSAAVMRRTDTSKSMSHLCSRPPSSSSSSSPEFNNSRSRPFLSPALTPRPTRTSLLRKDAQDAGNKGLGLGVLGMSVSERSRMLSKSMVHLARRTNEQARAVHTSASSSSPSRPHSSLSQQSVSSHNGSAVNIRARSTPRKPRPVSVASTMSESWAPADQRQSRSIEKKPPVAGKPPRAKSAGPTQAAESLSTRSSPPLPPKPTVTPRKPAATPTLTPTPRKTAATLPQQQQLVNEKPKTMTKPPRKNLVKSAPKDSDMEKVTVREDLKVASTTVKVESQIVTVNKEIVNEAMEIGNNDGLAVDIVQQDIDLQVKEEERVVLETPQVNDKGGDLLYEESLEDIMQPPDLVRVESVTETVESMETTVTVLSGQNAEGGVATKQKITTEEEAKALLAERRRLAREQAEKEAELERLRQEQLQREEEERIQREEEAQRLWEEEQERHCRLENERLQRAIEEQQQREEEEQLRRKEEALLKLKKEEAEAKAREEAEKLRKETEEKLKKEEEERAERRKRVKAIMSRTQKGTATPPVTTPNKTVEAAVEIAEKMAAEEKEKDESFDVTMATDEGKIAADMRDKEQGAMDIERTENGMHTNGFANHEHYNLIMDQSCGGDKSDDLSEFDPLNTLDVIGVDEQMSTKAAMSNVSILNNDDNMNSNLTSNGLGTLGTALHDNFSKQQDGGVAAGAEPFFI